MPSHFKLAAIILAAIAADDIKWRIHAYKSAKLYLASVKEYEQTEETHKAQISYLIDMLEKHQVPVTEFDLIALSYPRS